MTDDKQSQDRDRPDHKGEPDKGKSQIREIDCLEAIGQLYAYLDGELEGSVEKTQVEQHLEHCKSCYSRAQLEGAINQRLSNFHKDKAPESLQGRLKNIIDKL
jgi:anti-sigma factor (TIGR02949 family)